LLTIFVSSTVAIGCSCEPPPPPCLQYWRDDTVFVGKISKVAFGLEGSVPDVNVAVEENFKGMNFSSAVTSNDLTSCSFDFHEGQKYLFYAKISEKQANHFGTGYCSRTRIFESNLPDPQFLRSIKSQKSNYWVWATINGGFLDHTRGGIAAEVLGIKPKLSGQTDENGDLKIVVPGAGKYKVRIWLPKGMEWSATLRFDEELRSQQQKTWRGGGKTRKGRFMDFEVEVSSNHCGWIDLPLTNTN
jgi:hypothetical protein